MEREAEEIELPISPAIPTPDAISPPNPSSDPARHQQHRRHPAAAAALAGVLLAPGVDADTCPLPRAID